MSPRRKTPKAKVARAVTAARASTLNREEVGKRLREEVAKLQVRPACAPPRPSTFDEIMTPPPYPGAGIPPALQEAPARRPKPWELEDVANAGFCHPPTGGKAIRHERVRAAYRHLARVILENVGQYTTERDVALNYARTAMMWANAAIACNPETTVDDPDQY